MHIQDLPTGNGEELLRALQERCIAEGGSDIHLSPERGGVRLEWRQHGVLRPLGVLPHPTYVDLLRRVKFEAKMKLNIVTVPQDGQYTFEHGTDQVSRRINVRVATLPSRFGEALTLRFLDPMRGIIPLQQLGFPEAITRELQELIHLPSGLLLVTGPTGSGKTTTLYALLSTIIGHERHIVTLEDPIEYELPGIIQSQIDPAHDYDYSNGLRSVLRHDPDVILVGEIRDLETAQTAVNASLTGHVVLSTLHTNSAVEAIPRLLSMGVSPYTFGPALRAVLAQRLVRTLTPECRASKHCDPAAHESYGGQIAIPELLRSTPEIQQMIVSLEQGPAIEAAARKSGFKSIREWGEELVKQRITTKEEVERVTA